MVASDGQPSVRVEVLGPLRLVVGGSPVQVPGRKRRAVLALLALAEGRAVSVDHLVDALWRTEVPDSGRQALHSHVSRLRGHLGSASSRVETLDGGYRLVLGPDGLDVARARSLLARGRAEAAQAPAAAVAAFREARELWRGPVLADLTEIPPVAAAVVTLDQLHRDVTDALIAAVVEADRLGEVPLALVAAPGRPSDDVVGIAAAALADDPLREPAALLLMRVLAAAGRAAEALSTGREYRHRLAEEAGLDPTPALGQLERAIAGGAAGPAPERSRPSPAATTPSPAAWPTTRLIGREGQVGALRRLLGTERLVTLVGPGGVGKTRVASEVARSGGATAVLALAPITDPTAVPQVLAAALELQVVHGDVLAACVALLGAGPALLVIDNCEHLLDAVRDTVGVLLVGCPGLTVLTTSREPLGLSAERVFRLAPLPVPAARAELPEPAALRLVPSVAIFLDRASRVRPDFSPDADELAVVVEVVRRLDGMPLAIELAAGRMSTFSLPELHARLDRSLDLLGGGTHASDARHRTLRATIEWSYALLGTDEQRLFRHLAVFVDGVDLATAEQVAADLVLAAEPAGVLAHLVDASMLEARFEGPTRYRILETLRAFGLDRLEASGERAAADERLLRWASDLTGWIDTIVVTEQEHDADAALRRELPTLRAAWHLARSAGRLDGAVALVIGLYEVGQWRDLTEIWGWAEELAAEPALTGHARAAAVLGAAAEIAYLRGDHGRARRLARDGLALGAGDPAGTRLCLSALAVAELSRGAFPEVVEHALAAAQLATRPTEDIGVAALASAYSGDLDRARGLHADHSAIARSLTHRGFASYVAGEIDNAEGRWDRAEQHYRLAIDLGRRCGATFLVGIASVGQVSVLAAADRVDDALHGYREVIDYWADAGNWTHLWVTLRNLADLLHRLGGHQQATALDAAADQAPDAPAPAPGGHAQRQQDPAPSITRADVLHLARQAIAERLGRPRTSA